MSAGREALCEYCATGGSHQCDTYGEYGITGLPGALADYVAVPAVNAIRIDGDVDDAEAALTEPLSCIIHASDTVVARAGGRYQLNDDDPERRVRATLICGAGPAGLLFLQYLRHVFKYDGLLLVAEPNERKRQLAEGFGAEVIDPREVELTEAVAEKTGGRRVEFYEASGSGQVFSQIPGLIRTKRRAALLPRPPGIDLTLSTTQFMSRCWFGGRASGGFDATAARRSTAARYATSARQNSSRALYHHRYTSLRQSRRAGARVYSRLRKGVVMLG